MIRRLVAGMLAAGAVACAPPRQSLSEHHEASVAAHPSALEGASAHHIDFTTQIQRGGRAGHLDLRGGVGIHSSERKCVRVSVQRERPGRSEPERKLRC